MYLAALLALAATAAATPAFVANVKGEAELASAIGTRQPGKPVDCISPQDESSVQVIDGTAIVYGYGTRLYVNRLMDDGARVLRHDDVLVVDIYGGQLCRLDSVTLLDPPSRLPRAIATLGSFVPYSRPR